MLAVRGLSVSFGDFVAVKNISFQVSKGEIFGLLGANGAGKTTTIRVFCGLVMPSQGEIQLGDIIFGNGKNTADVIKSRIGYMSQKFTLYDDLTIQENWEFIASLRGMNRPLFLRRCDYLNQWLDLEDQTHKIVGSLPSGLKQQVALAAALFHDPDLIFLDEPTAGVGPYARQQFWHLIKTLAGAGKTIIVTTHYMDEAENCERLALMRSGEIIALDTPANLKKTSFPHGVWALREDVISPLLKDDLQRYIQEKKINAWSYGRNCHIVARDQYIWDELQKRHLDLNAARLIAPTLEDVFLELVEGRER